MKDKCLVVEAHENIILLIRSSVPKSLFQIWFQRGVSILKTQVLKFEHEYDTFNSTARDEV